MSKRHLKDLSANEIVGIVYSNLKDFLPMKDIAAKYHISASLVGRLVAQHKADGDMISDQRRREEKEKTKSEKLEVVVRNLLAKNVPISSSSVV